MHVPSDKLRGDGSDASLGRVNTVDSVDAIASDLIDELKRGRFESGNEFVVYAKARVHVSRQTQLINKLFEQGLAHIQHPAAIAAVQILLD